MVGDPAAEISLERVDELNRLGARGVKSRQGFAHRGVTAFRLRLGRRRYVLESTVSGARGNLGFALAVRNGLVRSLRDPQPRQQIPFRLDEMIHDLDDRPAALGRNAPRQILFNSRERLSERFAPPIQRCKSVAFLCVQHADPVIVPSVQDFAAILPPIRPPSTLEKTGLQIGAGSPPLRKW